MPLWQAQLDAVIGALFVRELGYLLSVRSRPGLRHGIAGIVDKNLPPSADGRFFLTGDTLTLSADEEPGWLHTGWFYNGAPSTSATLPITFTTHDLSVSALFAPKNYQTWRTTNFNHLNEPLGLLDDYNNDAVSAKTVDHDGDGLNNSGEYAFGADPYDDNEARWRPQMALVDVEDVIYPALRYRTNGAPPSNGDTTFVVQLSTNGSTWTDNSTTPTTLEISRLLQPDGSEIVTERTLLPASAFTTLDMRVAWSVTGVAGTPVTPAPLSITTTFPLTAGRVGVAYNVALAGTGGTAPYTWSVSSGALPTGLTLNSDGVLSGIPEAPGTAAFTVQLMDANNISETVETELIIQAFFITTASPLTGGLVGAVYPETTFAATGGTAPYIWSVSSGSLPPGLALSPSGILVGTPTAAGSHTFTVQISDTNSFTATKEFTLTVIQITIDTPSPLPSAVKDVPYVTNFSGTGGTAPTWTVSAGDEPVGLTLSEAGVLSGTPTATITTTSTFTVQITDDAEVVVTKEFSLTVYASYQKPVVNPITFGTTVVGAAFDYTLTATNYPKTFTITGLPKGLKYVPATGVISGRPAVSGVFNVKVKATNTGGVSSIVTAPLVVKALSNNMVGTFTGIIDRNVASNTNLGSRLALTTTINGSFTAKITTGTTSTSASGFLAGSAPQISVTIAGKVLSLSLANDLVSGTYGAAMVDGWRLVWDKKLNPPSNHAGYYSIGLDLADEEDDGVADIPQGSGYATFTVVEAGTLTVAGKTADGQALTSAAFMGPNGEIAVYAGLYANKGTLVGKLMLEEDEDGLFTNNTASGGLTWSKPTTVTKTYATAFGPINLDAYGKYLAPSSKGNIVLGLPDTGNANVVFTDGGLSESVTDPDFTFAYSDENKVTVLANDAQASLVINPASGAVSGKFTLTELTPTPPLVRKNIAFQGQIVRQASGATKAVGYFLLQQKPVGGQPISASPILSGGIAIEQPIAP
jgi:hypothetical protein